MRASNVMYETPEGRPVWKLRPLQMLVSLITVSDLTFEAYQLNQATLQTVQIFTLVLVMYLAIALVITFLMRGLERRVARATGRA